MIFAANINFKICEGCSHIIHPSHKASTSWRVSFVHFFLIFHLFFNIVYRNICKKFLLIEIHVKILYMFEIK